MKYISAYKNGVRIQLHIQPRASRTAIVGEHGDALKIAIQAPPVDGEANEAVLDFFKSIFKKTCPEIEILSGHKGRQKTIYLSNISVEEALKKLTIPTGGLK